MAVTDIDGNELAVGDAVVLVRGPNMPWPEFADRPAVVYWVPDHDYPNIIVTWVPEDPYHAGVSTTATHFRKVMPAQPAEPEA